MCHNYRTDTHIIMVTIQISTEGNAGLGGSGGSY